MGCCTCKVSTIIYVILQCLVLVFSVLGIAFDQYRPDSETRDENGDLVAGSYFKDSGCMTLWGYKEKCFSGGYTAEGTKDIWKGCPDRQKRFRAAEVLAIISIVLIAVALVLGFISLCCCNCLRVVCLVLGILTVGTLCVVWAMVADSFYNTRGPKGTVVAAAFDLNYYCGPMRKVIGDKGFDYGAGFALIIVGWALQFINCIIVMLPC